LVCDLSIAAENARFGQTGPKVGSFDGGYGSSLLARTIGVKRAKEIWFLCRQYDANQALEWGLVNTVVALDQLENETVAWCRQILTLSPIGPSHAEGRLQRAEDGMAGIQQLAGDATMLLLHVRRGPGGSQRLRRTPPAGFFEVSQASMSEAPGPLRRWVLAARPRTLPAAMVPVVVGVALIRPRTINWGNSALCLIVALALQVGTNYANDYSDGIRGTDEMRVGPFRLTASKLVSSSRVRNAAFASFCLPVWRDCSSRRGPRGGWSRSAPRRSWPDGSTPGAATVRVLRLR